MDSLYILFMIAVACGIVATVFWFWMLLDCLRNPRLQGTDKLTWVLVILCLHFVGAAIYYAVVRHGRT